MAKNPFLNLSSKEWIVVLKDMFTKVAQDHGRILLLGTIRTDDEAGGGVETRTTITASCRTYDIPSLTAGAIFAAYGGYCDHMKNQGLEPLGVAELMESIGRSDEARTVLVEEPPQEEGPK